MFFEPVMLSNHLILYHSLLILSLIFPSITVFSNRLFATGEYRVKKKNVFTWHLVVYTGLIQPLFYLNLPAMPRGKLLLPPLCK